MQRRLDLLVVGSRGYDPIGRLIEGRSSVADALAGAGMRHAGPETARSPYGPNSMARPDAPARIGF